MPRLSSTDHRQLLDVLWTVGESPEGTRCPEPALQALRALVPCDVVAYGHAPDGEQRMVHVGEPLGQMTDELRRRRRLYHHRTRCGRCAVRGSSRTTSRVAPINGWSCTSWSIGRSASSTMMRALVRRRHSRVATRVRSRRSRLQRARSKRPRPTAPLSRATLCPRGSAGVGQGEGHVSPAPDPVARRRRAHERRDRLCAGHLADGQEASRERHSNRPTRSPHANRSGRGSSRLSLAAPELVE